MIREYCLLNKKTVIRIIIIIFILSISTNIIAAKTFTVTTTVCAPSWQCSAYNENNCGNRTCIDINMCGTNSNKPQEYIACVTSLEKTKNNQKYNQNTSTEYPKGYFLLDKDTIKVTIEQNNVLQKIVGITTYEPNEYALGITYSKEYIQNKDFITSSKYIKNIANTDTFNLIIDSTNISAGTYVIPITVSNKYLSKTILLTVDVLQKDSPTINIILDSNIKTIGIDNQIETRIELDKNFNITNKTLIVTSIYDPKGNLLSIEQKPLNANSKNFDEKILLPLNLGEGYYTLAITLIGENQNVTQSQQFTIIEANKYLPVIQIPKKNILNTIILLIGTILLIAIILAIIIYKIFSKKEKYREIKMKLEKNKSLQKELETLKKSYDRGIISLSEYREGLKNRGYTIESVKNENISIKEKIGSVKNKDANNLSLKKKNNELIENDEKILDKRCDENNAFGLHQSKKIYSIKELLIELHNMSQETIDHHVNNGRNDFSNWINGVFHLTNLAEEIVKCHTREELIKTIEKHNR